MVDQAEQLNRSRRLQAARTVEQAVSAFVTQIAFDPNEPLDLYAAPNGESILRDTHAVLTRTADAPDAELRLRAAGRLERAVANTITSDVPGLAGAVQPLPTWVLEQIALRQADNRALIDALAGAPLVRGGQPWVPTPTPPLVGGEQAGGEKTELPSATISIDGASQTPALIGFAANISEQAMRSAGDALLLLVAEAATVGLANYLIAQLDGASAAATDIAAGIAAVEAAGFAPDLIVGSRSAIADALPGATPAAYPGIVFGPTGGAIYVVARSGVWFQTDEPTTWMLAEPAIGGREMSAFCSAVFDAGAGAVQKIAGAAGASGRSGKGQR